MSADARERIAAAKKEFDNIRWEDVLGAVAERDPNLEAWTRKYLRYVREDLAAADRILSEMQGAASGVPFAWWVEPTTAGAPFGVTERYVADGYAGMGYAVTPLYRADALAVLRRLLRQVDEYAKARPYEWVDHGCVECVGENAIRPEDGFRCARHAARALSEAPAPPTLDALADEMSAMLPEPGPGEPAYRVAPGVVEAMEELRALRSHPETAAPRPEKEEA